MQSTPSGLAGELAGVSCPTAKDCIAAGWYQIVGGTSVTLAEDWSGATWTIVSTPSPSGRRFADLTSVSCGISTCEAAGFSSSNAGKNLTLAEGN
jgi:hypothetical protein